MPIRPTPTPSARPRRSFDARPAGRRAVLGMACAFAAALVACGGGGADGGGDEPALPAATRQQIDALVTSQLAAQQAPGAVLLVDIPGEGVYKQSYGVGNLETGAPRRADDPFRIASITKTFTATAILQLVGAGKLSLDDTVSTWYPDFPNGDRITIDDLLRMRSGIADSADAAFLLEYDADPLRIITPDEMIARSSARADAFEAPDTKTVYTNVNFMLLERIAVAVDGRPLQAQLSERVFGPLGMTHTLYPTASQIQLGGSTRGYGYDSAARRFVDKTVLNPEPAGGAGAMISTLDDLRRYARAVCTDSGLIPSRLYRQRVQGATIDGALEFIRYGAGIELLGEFCGHNGTIMGFSSEMFYLPAQDAVVVLDVNRLDVDDRSQSTTIFLLLARQLFPDHVEW